MKKLTEEEFINESWEFAWKWIERAIFSENMSVESCLEILKNAPHAPWNNPDIDWDTSHLPYHDKISKTPL